MVEVRVTPRTEEEAVTIDVCERCRGVWLDEAELEGLCPSVSHLPSRRMEVALLGARGAGIARCPRCNAAPIEFAVVDLLIDFCDTCGGVWLDGAEVDELLLPSEEQDAARTKRARQGGYRASALRAVRKGVVECAECRRTVSIEDTFVLPSGFVCNKCYASNIAQTRIDGPSAPRAIWLVIAAKLMELLRWLRERRGASGAR
jgi:Zn-finger nucleic acid-binding protein